MAVSIQANCQALSTEGCGASATMDAGSTTCDSIINMKPYTATLENFRVFCARIVGINQRVGHFLIE